MANCPKCGVKLKPTDWRQHCPSCGANIVVYDLQERLMQDADIAEVQYYYFQKRIDRVKASFVGTKLAIIRIFTSLLPIIPLFLPLIRVTFPENVGIPGGKITLYSIINNVGDVDVNEIFSLLSGDMKRDASLFIAAAVMFAVSVVLILVHFILLTLSCSPKGKPRNIIQDVIMLLTSVGAAVCILIMPNAGKLTASLSYGAFIYIFLQIVSAVVDFMCIKQGIPVVHKQCYVGGIPIEEYFELQKTLSPEEIRAEQYKRLTAIQLENEKKIAEDEAKKHHNLSEEAVTSE